jgi:hypothetical protein
MPPSSSTVDSPAALLPAIKRRIGFKEDMATHFPMRQKDGGFQPQTPTAAEAKQMACAAWQNFKDKRQPDGAQPDLAV